MDEENRLKRSADTVSRGFDSLTIRHGALAELEIAPFEAGGCRKAVKVRVLGAPPIYVHIQPQTIPAMARGCAAGRIHQRRASVDGAVGLELIQGIAGSSLHNKKGLAW